MFWWLEYYARLQILCFQTNTKKSESKKGAISPIQKKYPKMLLKPKCPKIFSRIHLVDSRNKMVVWGYQAHLWLPHSSLLSVWLELGSTGTASTDSRSMPAEEKAFNTSQITAFEVHPCKLTWNLNVPRWKRRNIYRPPTFSFHVNFRGCTTWGHMTFYFLYTYNLQHENLSIDTKKDALERCYLLSKMSFLIKFGYLCEVSGGGSIIGGVSPSEKYAQIKFKIFLPNRGEDKTLKPPPTYSYMCDVYFCVETMLVTEIFRFQT